MAEKEELENTPDEKKDKKEKKKREKEEKKKKKGENEEETEEEKLSSKVALVFVTFLIIIIWLGIIAILIKADVGGFGSTVLAPLLKDVPYVNRILPETSDGEDLIEDTEHQFDSLDEAIARIKELELALDDAGSKAAADAQTIADLQEQVTDLAKYRDEQAEFEKLQEKFYESYLRIYLDKRKIISYNKNVIRKSFSYQTFI